MLGAITYFIGCRVTESIITSRSSPLLGFSPLLEIIGYSATAIYASDSQDTPTTKKSSPAGNLVNSPSAVIKYAIVEFVPPPYPSGSSLLESKPCITAAPSDLKDIPRLAKSN